MRLHQFLPPPLTLPDALPVTAATTVGPAPHFSVPKASLEAVGNSNTGPAPQIQPLAVGATGEKKRLWTMSPSPSSPIPSIGTSSWSMSGTIVREIRFHSSLSEIGITGWTFSRQTEPSSSGPIFSS